MEAAFSSRNGGVGGVGGPGCGGGAGSSYDCRRAVVPPVMKQNRWLVPRERLRDSPSRRHGIDQATETRYQKAACSFIDRLTRRCDMGRLVACTGMVFIHRFFTRYSWKDVDRTVIAASCTFLACKVEERPKKLREVIKEVLALVAKDEKRTTTPAQQDDESVRMQEQIVMCEKVLLSCLEFDFSVVHPFQDFEDLRFRIKHLVPVLAKHEKLFQSAYTILNDSMFTPLCILCEPSVTAAVVMYIALRLHDVAPPPTNEGSGWKVLLKLDPETDLYVYIDMILDLYPDDERLKTLRSTFLAEEASLRPPPPPSYPAPPSYPPPPAGPPPPPPLHAATKSSADDELEEGELEEGELLED